MSKDNLSLRAILDRLKVIEGVSSDKDLAEPLETKWRTIAGWKERDALPPFSIVLSYCERKNISLEWAYFGRGPMKVTDLISPEAGVVYTVETNQDAVYSIASDVYRALLEAGKEIEPEKFLELVRLLHRDMLESKAEGVAFEKVVSIIRLVE